jgi:hypothetical protein
MEIPEDRREAERLSHGCPECSGGGLTSRYIERVNREGETSNVSVGCVCHRCVMGRWVVRAHDRAGKGPLPFIDLGSDAYGWLQDEIYKFPPTWADLADNPAWSNNATGPSGSIWRAKRAGLRAIGSVPRSGEGSTDGTTTGEPGEGGTGGGRAGGDAA